MMKKVAIKNAVIIVTACLLILLVFFSFQFLLKNPKTTPKPKQNQTTAINTFYKVQQDKITLNFGKSITLTKKEYPQLFNSFAYKDTTQYYTSSLINYSTPNTDMTGSGQVLRLDRIVWAPALYTEGASLFYVGNGVFLVSPQEQAEARFPDTDIVSTSPLTIRFHYDVSQPAFCYGYDCRGYWADFYEWNTEKGQFINVNTKYKSYFRDLLAEYENLNLNGCDTHYVYDIEQVGVKTLEALYKSSKTNYCKNSSRDDLNRFIKDMAKVKELTY